MKKTTSITPMAVVGLAFILAACGATATPKEEIAISQCPAGERPQMCAQVYNPVCGFKGQDATPSCGPAECPEQWQTYSNGCVACSDTKVHGFLKGGECESQKP